MVSSSSSGDVDRCRVQAVPLLGLLDLQGRAPAEDVGHQAAVPGIQVLHHHEGRRKVRGQGRQHLAQGRQPARRGRQGHDVKGRAREAHRRVVFLSFYHGLITPLQHPNI
jgi:hypothetical protein